MIDLTSAAGLEEEKLGFAAKPPTPIILKYVEQLSIVDRRAVDVKNLL